MSHSTLIPNGYELIETRNVYGQKKDQFVNILNVKNCDGQHGSKTLSFSDDQRCPVNLVKPKLDCSQGFAMDGSTHSTH